MDFGVVDDHASRFARALRDALHDGGPSAAQVGRLRDESIRVAAESGLSQQQYNDVLRRAGLPLLAGNGASAVPGRLDTPIDTDALMRQTLPTRDLGMVGEPGFAGEPPRRKRSGAVRAGTIAGVIGAVIGICAATSALLITAIPSSTLWMSEIVCNGPYHLAYGASGYSYTPGQSGTTADFLCVGPTDYHDVNPFVIFGLQSLPAALVVCAVAGAVWRRRRSGGN
ncbi:hypothetical protein [Mycobacterium sp. 852002-51057_SCH5723018]|uniref:hypothetical protein n=1 Tax=Mycobacterium sp. 852002-51057_SCH5723018 TaxID=1834094 RepID=UPI0007FD15E6|nr:hypothetical protein [Mycobacterium sp. 852002-51057_SCH5723018]OBG27836.1 hypothetical protein A5764_02425 [Mycobacterium sp. 852002-51057_SCH5723018]